MDKFSLTNRYLFFLPLGNVDWTNYYYYSFKKSLLWDLLAFLLEVQSGFWPVASAGNW